MEMNPVFARRLYLCWLISNNERPNVPSLMEQTGWPRRTLQDVLKALPGLGLDLQFVQQGKRHNDGYYQLADWGPLSQSWINQHHEQLFAAIG